MKLESLAKGAPDCPLIRLYAFTQDETKKLMEICNALPMASLKEVALHVEPWIERVAGCELYLRVGERDLGIVELKSPFGVPSAKKHGLKLLFL